MIMRHIIGLTAIVIFLFMAFSQLNPLNAQKMKESSLPYRKIPDTPEIYSATNAIARMIDGLGYRYYWATEGLRKEDLEYQISADSRTALETLDHIHGLSFTILNAAQNVPNERGTRESLNDFKEMRRETLNNLAQASDIFKNASDEQIDLFNVIFKRGNQESSYPVWNLINGMISDAIWHSGQIVSFRRASGNPIHSGVSVFRGVTRE